MNYAETKQRITTTQSDLLNAQEIGFSNGSSLKGSFFVQCVEGALIIENQG